MFIPAPWITRILGILTLRRRVEWPPWQTNGGGARARFIVHAATRAAATPTAA
jgi:hypothetical protein